jgi:hypothetical protein
VLFCTGQGGLPLAARGPGLSWHSVVKDQFILRERTGRTPCSLSNYLLTLRAPRQAKEYSAWSQLFTNNSSRKPRNDATDGAFYRLVAAARRKQFGAKPGRVVAVTALTYEFLLSQ